MEELKTILTAVGFLTRIPTPSLPDYTAERLARSAAYFPLVGAMVGALAGSTYWLARQGLPGITAAALAMGVAAIVTGAFHEDAFADVCDAFGGYTPWRRREIMRDSRVGSFGVVGTVLLLLAEAGVLAALSPQRGALALIAAHALGRWSSVAMIRLFPNVSDSESLAKPFAEGTTALRLLGATVVPVAAALLLGPIAAAVSIGASLTLAAASGFFFRPWIGGITGDCLGAVNKLAEFAVCAIAFLAH